MALPLTDSLLGVDALARHLDSCGWKVQPAAGRPERSLVDLFDEPPRYLKVTGRAIGEVRLRLGGSPFLGEGRSTLKLGPIPVHHTRTVPMQLHFLVFADPAGRLDDFEAKLSTRRGGFFWLGDVEHAAWTGGALAPVFNEEPERTLSGARCLKLGESLLVRPDADRRCVRIIHQTQLTARFSLLSSEVLSAERHLPEPPLLETLEWLAQATRRFAQPPRATGKKATQRRGASKTKARR